MDNKRRVILVQIAVIISLCFIISPQRAYAASSYTMITVGNIRLNSSGQAVGIIRVDIDDCSTIRAGDRLTVNYSSDISIGNAGEISVAAERTSATEEIVVPASIHTTPNGIANTSLKATITSDKTSLDIVFNGNFTTAASSNPGCFFIYLKNVNVGSIDGDLVNATISASSGSSFTSGSVTVARTAQPVDVLVPSIKLFATPVTGIGFIMLVERCSQEFTPGTIINFVLSPGFEWDESNTDQTVSIEGKWGVDHSGNNAARLNLGSTAISNIWYEISRPTPTILRITFLSNYVLSNVEARLNIGNAMYNTLPVIRVAGATVHTDVTALISSPNNAYIKQQTLVLGEYVDAQTINAKLSDLRIDNETVTGFSPEMMTYNVMLPYGTTSVPVVSATKETENASYNINQAINLTGTEYERTATVIVKAQRYSITKTYKVIFSVDTSNPDCFIATAAYGSYLDPHVWVLRQFRDNILLHSSGGRWFVKEYYLHSPPIAAFIAQHSSLRLLTMVALTPIIFAIALPKISAIVLILGVIVLMSKRKYLITV
ncbi:MAG: CFI-box-CTERM domain-containing protein [Oscillospiraceae bacterium]